MNGANNGKSRNFSADVLCRQGVITEEMQYVAQREKLTPELVRDEVARRPSHHSRQTSITGTSNPMALASPSSAESTRTIGNSATTSDVDAELEKLHRRCTTVRTR